MLFKEFHHLWLPKSGNTRGEYEDAAACDLEGGRFAIADGASESAYAGPWARLLVEGYLRTPLSTLQTWIGPLRERWLRELGSGPFPWYTQSKIEQGAFSTFLGLALEMKRVADKPITVWNAIAVGDTCIFHVRADQCVRKFPLERYEDFDNSPCLLCSRKGAHAPDEGTLESTIADNVCQPGDSLWLMTDALAAWFLQRDAEGSRPWDELKPSPELCKEDQVSEFETWVDWQREAQALRNDDVTLMVIRF